MRRVMAVCDTDPFYAARLAEVINRKEKIPFEVIAFSSLERLRSYSRDTKIELLLVGEQTDLKEVKELPVNKVLFLSGDGTRKKQAEYPSIFKYQSSNSLIREVMACYCEGAPENAMDPIGTGAFVAGVYSPLSRCMKSSFALVMGKMISRDSHALYITLEEYTGLSALTGEEYREDLSDLMYYYSQGNQNTLRLSSVIHSMGGLDYIPPARYPEDLADMDTREMAKLLKWIADGGGYETLLLDVGNYGHRVLPILDICSVIYMPVLEDVVSRAKLNEFLEHMECAGYGGVKEKIKKLKLPVGTAGISYENFPEQLMWGELGDYVRQILKGGVRQ